MFLKMNIQAFPQSSWFPFIGGIVLLVALILAGMPNPVRAQTTPTANPNLTPICGLNVILVLDESGSLQGFESTVRNSVRALLDGLADTGSRVALVEFNLDARTPLGADYREVTTGAGGSLSPGGAFDLYLNNNYHPNGYTNWDAALVQVETINREHGVAPLVVFFTDSEPTVYINRFGSIVGGNNAVALDEAVQSANLVKVQGSHIFVVGVGNINDETNLSAISGVDEFPQSNLPFGQVDYTVTAFAQLENTLRQIVFNLCAPSFVVTKRMNTGSGLGYELRPDQPFTGTVAIDQAGQMPDAFEWALPVTGPATQVGQTQARVTNANGMVRWQWTPGSRDNAQPWLSHFSLAETLQPGDTFVEALCTRRTLTSDGNYTANSFLLSALPTTVDVGSDDIVLCDVRNSHVDIGVKKIANPTSVPESGGNVVFTFQVSNGGGTAVSLTALVDSVFGNVHGQGNCVANGLMTIAPGSTYTCSVTKLINGNTGAPHVNTVTATVVDAQGVTVSRSANATVTFSDAAPLATLTRSASPATLPEPGGPVVYTVQVTNNNGGEPLTITALSNTLFGNVTTVGGAISATTCTVPTLLTRATLPGSVYSCQFTAQVSGPPGPIVETLQVDVSDDDNNALTLNRDQLITILDIAPQAEVTVATIPESRPEPGGVFTFQVTVKNTNPSEALTLSDLTDTVYGNITAQSGLITVTNCILPQVLAPAGQANAAYVCTFSTPITGAPGGYFSTLQARVDDDDGGTLTLSQTTAAEITDIASSLLVTKAATPRTVTEPGGIVTFTVTAINTSPLDQVRLEKVIDTIFGDISASCSPTLPATLTPQQQVQCRFVRTISGTVGERHVNEVTAFGVDDDGKPVADRDQETVEITDLPARLDIIQVATPSNLPEPGGNVTFAASIKNISTVDVIRVDKVETNAVNPTSATIDVSANCTPTLPVNLQPGAQLQCSFTKFVTGPVGTQHTSQVVVTGVDDDELPVQQTGYEAVEIVDVPATLRVTKSANPVSVPEAGGMVNFSVEVQNTSAVDTITLHTLENNQFGALNTTCAAALPVVLAPGAKLTCNFSRLISGDTGALITLQTTATGTDDDGKTVSDDTVVAIGITDTPSLIKVVQTTAPTSIREPGGEVVFTVEVENTSAVDTVTINGINDSRFGAFGASCTPALPTALAPHAKLLCRFTQLLVGDAGTTFASTVSVTGVDDDGQPVTDFDLGNLDVADVVPQLAVDVTATPNQVLETGAMVNFTVQLVNHGPEAITVESIVDTSRQRTAVHSTATTADPGQTDCVLPQILAANGGSYRCVVSKMVTGSHTTTYEALITATAIDNEGNRIQAADEADVFLLAVAPELALTKRDSLVIDHFTREQDRGKPSPGDTLGYEVVVRNIGNGPATDVVLTDIPDASTTLVIGSVQTSKGIVALGNTPGNGLIVITIGDIAAGEQVVVRFQVIITEGSGATLLRNQATLSQGITGASVAGSDDPDTPFFGDPTDTIVVLSPTGLPSEEEPPVDNLGLRLFLPLIAQ